MVASERISATLKRRRIWLEIGLLGMQSHPGV
jgi:hypothetical protein